MAFNIKDYGSYGAGTVDTLTGLAASTATQNGGGQGGFPSGYCLIYCNEIKNEDTTWGDY